MAHTTIQLLYLLLMPALALWLCRRSRLAALLGPVVFAYLFGMLLPSLPLAVESQITVSVRDISIPLAIPLLLFTLDIRGWFRHAGVAAGSFALCVLALLVMALAAYVTFASLLPNAGDIAGMLVGMYTGGMPNMAVVHRTLEAPAELFLQVNTVDILAGGIYFLFLISLAGPVYGRLLAAYPDNPAPLQSRSTPEPARLRGLMFALLAAIAIVVVSVAVTWLVSGEPEVAPVMLGVTSLAILGSFWPALHRVKLSYPAGYYLVLVFCCAIGSQVDLSRITEGAGMIAAMLLFIFIGTICLHLMLARLFGIDRDTAIITQTAALYGPPFVPPVANALRNPEILLSGLTTGLVGYALGNYLGMGMGLWLRGF